jgi:hypothetical protein
VDEENLAIVALSSNTAAVSSSIASGTVNIRYNVVAVDGIFSGERNTIRLTARIADNGTASQVIVRLNRQNISTGVKAIVGELNSNDFSPSSVAQKRSIVVNCQGPAFDFENNVYYIEVLLIKTAAGGNPLIRALQICGGLC